MILTYIDWATIKIGGFVQQARKGGYIRRVPTKSWNLCTRSKDKSSLAPQKLQNRAQRVSEWVYQLDTHSKSDLNAIHLTTSDSLRLSIEKPGDWYSTGRLVTTCIEGGFK